MPHDSSLATPPEARRTAMPAAPGPSAAFLAILAYFVLQFGFGSLFGGLSTWLARHWPDAVPDAPDRLIVVVILTLVCSASLIVALVVRRWGPLTATGAPAGLGFATPEHRFLAIGTALGLAAPLVGGVLTHLLAGEHEVSQAVSDIANRAHVGMRIALLPVVVAVGPLVEETIFRGALLAQLRRRMGDGGAIALSAAVFGLVHLPDLDWLWYAVPNLMLVGAICGWLRVRSGSIWPAVVAHAANNAVATIAWFAAS